jgi:hypothetical protein
MIRKRKPRTKAAQRQDFSILRLLILMRIIATVTIERISSPHSLGNCAISAAVKRNISKEEKR